MSVDAAAALVSQGQTYTNRILVPRILVKKLRAPKMLDVANPMQQKSSGVQDDDFSLRDRGPSSINTAETVSRTIVPNLYHLEPLQ